MIQALDHIVILVDDLASATDSYEQLGFTVVAGGEHADGNTHNVLVSFADGTYLELLAFRREAPQHTWWRHVAGGAGLIDFALLPGDTGADVAAARGRGLAIDGPFAGGRLRPDGVRLAWQTARPANPALPFLCGDVTDRALRVPHGAAHQHPNGATGIAEVAIAVADPAHDSADYARLLGLPAEVAGPDQYRFQLGAHTIRLTPAGADPEAARRLAVRGPGIFRVQWRTAAGAVEVLDPVPFA